MDHYRPTEAVISGAALVANFQAIRRATGTKVLAVVKANAYGHGAVTVARLLSPLGVAMFGVSLVEEGLELREAGITEPILVLSPTFSGAERVCVESELTPVLGTFRQLEAFDALGRERNEPVPVHIELDTGIHRQGFNTEEWPPLFARLPALSGVAVRGVQSHFANADVPADPENAQQLSRFHEALRASGLAPAVVHISNSAAAIAHPEARLGMVRAGLALYGISPLADNALALQPVLRWTTRIAALHTLPAGSAVSYGGTFVTARESRIATLPVGYADGYPRALGNRAHAVVHGARCPIVGRVCMDVVLLDVTDSAAATVGSEVELLGESVSAHELAELMGTIPYEILSRISRRVYRRLAPG